MNNRLISIAAKVIAKADREHPADAVLRQQLKEAEGISRQDGWWISRTVFAYYRWLGWLDQKTAMPDRLRAAADLNEAFQKKPESFPAAELQRAIPKWVKDHVSVSTEWLRSLQAEPGLWLRARPGKGRELASELGECWVAGEGALGDSLRYEGSNDLFRSPQFHAGEFELQDISSQVVGMICAPEPGETWWDACAGEGGKMLHLCDLMQNKGLVWASDRAAWRLQKLKRRAARAKVFNYRTVLWDGGAKLPTKTKFDGILVDAPCSGMGTWQRNPQARWTATAEDVRELSEVQTRLLTGAAAALKPGGKLIYSVCTLTHAETVEVAEAVTRQCPELKPMELRNPVGPKEPINGPLWMWPETAGGNGMFICGWRKQAVQSAKPPPSGERSV
ncbi:MAG: rsmB 1 [Pedosphaera sp.]|nr:rsmB 1 [Pedosphaera sp.]